MRNKYPFTTKLGIDEVRKRLHKANVHIWYKGEQKKEFNNFHWNTFVNFYGMKGEERYAYNRALDAENPSYVCSQQAIDLIVGEVLRDPDHIIDTMVDRLKKKQ